MSITSKLHHLRSTILPSIWGPRPPHVIDQGPTRVPPELLLLIFEHAFGQDSSHQTAYALLFVCRFVHAEAERQIYRDIRLQSQLPHGDSPGVKHSSLFHALQNNPRLAQYAVSLDLSIESMTKPLTSYWVSFQRTLTLLPNLKTLILRLTLSSSAHSPMIALFKDCPFQLKTFAIVGFVTLWPGTISLLEQREIEDLEFPGVTGTGVDFDGQTSFPNLKILSASAPSGALAFIDRPSLRAVNLVAGWILEPTLRLSNITSLRTILNDAQHLSIFECFPSLRYLRIDSWVPITDGDPANIRIAHLKVLEKLHLETINYYKFLLKTNFVQDIFSFLAPNVKVLAMSLYTERDQPHMEWARGDAQHTLRMRGDDEWKSAEWAAPLVA